MKRVIHLFEKLNNTLLITMNISFMLILGFVDFLIGIEFDFSIFYLIPISLTAWFASKQLGVFAAIISEIIWFAADMYGGHIYSSTIILLGNMLIRLGLFLAIAILFSNFKNVLKKQHQSDLLLQKNKNIVETFQRLTTIIAGNIIQQNAEIIMWVNKKKNKGESVSERVEKASKIIGLSIQQLTESGFMTPYRENFDIDSESYLESIEEKLKKINFDVNSETTSSFVQKQVANKKCTSR